MGSGGAEAIVLAIGVGVTGLVGGRVGSAPVLGGKTGPVGGDGIVGPAGEIGVRLGVGRVDNFGAGEDGSNTDR